MPLRLAALLAAVLWAGCAGAGRPAGEVAAATPAAPDTAGPARVPAAAERAPAQDTAPPLALVLNVPAERLDAFEHGERTRSWGVAVGTRAHATPLGSFAITDVTWNPWWVPPESEWARNEARTPPGPANPMGRVKLRFFEDYFLHGTPLVESIGAPASHGCVRLRNADAIELALLVHRHGGPAVPAAELERLIADPRATRTYALAAPVPLEIVYRLAEVHEGRLVVHPDIYGRGAASRADLLAALAESGIDPARVSPERLEALLAQAGGGRASVAVDSLLGASE